MSFNHVSRIDDLVPIRNAIVSVYDKAGLEDLARGLLEACPGIRIYSTGGTLAALRKILGAEENSYLVPMETYTGQPEMKGGLVKTLDWKIYLGLLAEPYDEEHRADLERLGAVSFDLVVGNLYPFRTVTSTAVPLETARQNIDIGGPCMLRAAAKNFLRVAGVCDPGDYPGILRELRRTGGSLCLASRIRFAQKVFETTARYDAAIATFLNIASPAALRSAYEVVDE